jgi:hypothetical protein
MLISERLRGIDTPFYGTALDNFLARHMARRLLNPAHPDFSRYIPLALSPTEFPIGTFNGMDECIY